MAPFLSYVDQNLDVVRRQHIDAPPTYVSVYHETTAAALPGINKQGLVLGFADRNLGGFGETGKTNQCFDNDRPGYLVAANVSRVRIIFAYISLDIGFSLGWAAQRYVMYADDELRTRYVSIQEADPDLLTIMGVHSPEEYIQKMRDPRYLREKYEGEVLEMKVDPQKTYVGDLAVFTDIVNDIESRDGVYRSGDAKPYWEAVIKLADFQEWYRRAVDTSEDRMQYRRIEGAPVGLPDKLRSPEVLIPHSIPPQYIRVLP